MGVVSSPRVGVARGSGFSEQLRAATGSAHDRAETSPFVLALLTGELDRGAYAALLGQLWHVYAALEAVGDALVDDPVAGPFVIEELRRRPALERDLAILHRGHGPRVPSPSPATVRYVARLHEVVAWPAGFVAHHYTRYLGDLAGGQAIRVAVRRHYGLEGEQGTAFFVFPDIPSVKRFRDGYRQQLDALPIAADERDRVAAEAVIAFELNTEVFGDLHVACGPGVAEEPV